MDFLEKLTDYLSYNNLELFQVLSEIWTSLSKGVILNTDTRGREKNNKYTNEA